MYIQLLKSKIRRVKITQAELHYNGSITIDPALTESAATKAQIGDLVIIIAYAFMSLDEVKVHEPTIIFPDESNKLTLEV